MNKTIILSNQFQAHRAEMIVETSNSMMFKPHRGDMISKTDFVMIYEHVTPMGFWGFSLFIAATIISPRWGYGVARKNADETSNIISHHWGYDVVRKCERYRFF